MLANHFGIERSTDLSLAASSSGSNAVWRPPEACGREKRDIFEQVSIERQRSSEDTKGCR